PVGAVGNGSGGVLDALSDVDAASPNDGECLAYNNSSGNWEASANCGSGGSSVWSDSGSGYIEYTDALGGVRVASVAGNAPVRGVSGGGGGSSLWLASAGNVYRDTGFVGIGTDSPGYTLHVYNPDTNWP